MPRPLSLAAQLLPLLAVALFAGAALAADSASPPAPTARHLDVAGILVPIAAGMSAKVETATAPTADQWLAQLTLAQQASESVRVEVYANPRRHTPSDWVAAAWQGFARATLLRPVEAGVPRWRALRGEIAASPQSHARSVAFVAAGPRLVHVACAVPDLAARRRCDAVVAGLNVVGAP